jgi:hypothetical protein
MNGKIEHIEELLREVRETYGPHSIEPYGDGEDPRSVGFRVCGISATFSVIAEDRLPEDHYNVQIESYPPQSVDYLYHAWGVSRYRLLELIEVISGPRDRWPSMERH